MDGQDNLHTTKGEEHMRKFTDLLNAYLEAYQDYKEAEEEFKGEDFDYFNYRVIERLKQATNKLDEAFEKATKEKNT